MQGTEKEIFGETGTFLLGEQFYQTEEITVAEHCERGCLLSRASDGTLEVWNGTTGEPFAVYCDKDELKAGIHARRVAIRGKFRADVLNVNGNPATVEQKDKAKSTGIIFVDVVEINQED